MITPTAESNLHTYEAATVASYYASLNYQTPCERLLFDSYIKPGSAILDLGVGGGRTTARLASEASSYVGVDYARTMIEACHAKFPDLNFFVGHASDLSAFSDESFHAVVFAFNGIDYVLPASLRRACLEHIHRVLTPRGVVIFSSHNPRAIVLRQGWNRSQLQRVARRFSARSKLMFELLLAGLTALRSTWALFQSAGATLLRMPRMLSRAFWHGEGEMVDPAHGGLLTHCWIPQRAIAELNSAGFRVERVLGDDYPRPSSMYATDWYYYVFTKSCDQVSRPCA